MATIRLFLVDTFTSKIFHGHTAAVCVLKQELNDELMHAIAIENQYPETVFILSDDKTWPIRWFNSQGEVLSSGHGLLAAGFVLFEGLRMKSQTFEFKTHLGQQVVYRKQDKLFLDYPMTDVFLDHAPNHLWQHFSIEPTEIWQNGPDILVYFAKQEQAEKVQIHWDGLSQKISGALVLTSEALDANCYVRCFFPRVSTFEETATPAIYPRLLHFWEHKHQKQIHLAEQGLVRRSEVYCERHADRLWVGGDCRFYFRGDLLL